jgi:anaerobic magnesium-protoporphyrin IX monomethyl ester cyclase
MDAVLIQPPQPDSLDDRLGAPLHLLYIAGYVHANSDHRVSILDLSGGVPWDIPYADCYGITMYTPAFNICHDIAIKCKEVNPSAIVVAGGAHPTALPHTIGIPFDLVVGNEGEQAFLDILNGGRWHSRFVYGEDVDIGTFNPDLTLVDYSTYHRLLKDKQAPELYTYRGCGGYHCAYCTEHNKTLRLYNADNVKYILDYFKSAGNESVVVWDTYFTYRRSRWYPIADMINDYGFTYRCNGKIGVDSYEDMKKLKDTGCVLFNIGLESGSQKIIDLMNKKFSIDEAKNYIRNVQDAGLTYRVFLQCCFPGETEETLEETMRFIEEVDIDQYSCFTHNPYPGTDVYNHPEKYGITWLSNNWDDYYTIAGTEGMGGMPFETEYLTRGRAIELNMVFVEFLRARKWRGPKELYHQRVGI